MPAPEEKGPSEPLGTSEESPTELVFHLQSPTETFDLRIAGAFPGKLGLIEIANPTEAVERLGALLLPTVFRRNDLSHDPIWWFRGHSSQSVETFRDLEGGRCLLNHMELTLRRVVAYRSIDTAHQFVYVECDPDPPVGSDPHSLRSLEERVAERGYAAEEYGLFRGMPSLGWSTMTLQPWINGKL
ncbi:MAG: hypothetical protein U5R14_08490 [Gemmatimonadota bacterium]|nr:hypothetical protein [Gemmatimonadota bacterium]